MTSNKNAVIEENKTIGNLNHNYKIKVPYQTYIEWAEQKRAHKQIHGFRPGKAPISMFKDDWSRECASACASDLIKEKGFKKIFNSTFGIEKFETNEEILMNLFIELYPEVPEIDCSKIVLNKYKANVEKANVEQTIENWKKNNFKPNSINETRPIILNDFVTVSGYIINPFGGKEQIPITQVQIGKHKLLPEIEEKLIGKTVGQIVEHEVVIDKDNPIMKKSNLKGDAIAKFYFNIDSVNAPVNYEMNDMFSVFKVQSEAELKNHFKHSLESESEEFAKKILKDKLKYELGKFFFEIPMSLWQNKITQVERQMLEQIGVKEGDNVEAIIKEKLNMSVEDFQKRIIAIAESAARISFLVDHFARIYSLNISEEEINEEIALQGENFPGGKQAAAAFFKENEEARSNIIKRLLEDKVTANMIKKCQIEDKEVTLDELFKINILDEPIREAQTTTEQNIESSTSEKKAASKKKVQENEEEKPKKTTIKKKKIEE